ncbi:MAG: hypothetical protein NUV45_12740 [Tepidanaerobacteraceae bacterium]|jgi:surface polysaccharide O-acyltransferase-like enzyme|nr:hypothetical protein [Tepidanaerobacteraceae bacterium]
MGTFYLAATALAIAEAYVGFLEKGQPYLRSYASVRPPVLIDPLTIIPFLFLIGEKARCHQAVLKVQKNISRYSYGIYFVHPQILAVLNVALGCITCGLFTSRMIYMLFLIFLTFALSYLFCLIVDNSPLRIALLGLESKKQA